MNSCISNFRSYLVILTVVTLSMLLLYFGASEWLIRTKVEPQDLLFSHIAFFHKTDANNAIFGDSHVARGFNGQNGFVNLGYPAENIRTACTKARLYFTNRSPGIVILQADAHVFSQRRTEKDHQIRFYRHESEASFRWWELRVLNNYFRRNLFNYWKLSLKQEGLFMSKFNLETDGAILNDKLLCNMDPEARLKQAQHIFALQLPQADFQSHIYIEDYLETIRFLKQRGARIVLVSFPLSPEYRALAELEANYMAVFPFFKQFAREQAVEYFNYFDTYDDPRLFSDANHLNRDGAKHFARRLVTDLRATQLEGDH